jgi:deoxyribonuclease V
VGRLRHTWELSIAEAARLQETLRARVVQSDRLGTVTLVAGADVAESRDGKRLHAAVAVLDARTLRVVEVAAASRRTSFPYVPGYLSFRELPVVLDAWAALSRRPDLVLCDAHGRAHPRRMGLACHLGLWLDLPAIGCAKTRLVGAHREPGRRRGCHRRLLEGCEVIGEVVRTRDGVRPVFVSVGHKIGLPTARRWVLRLALRYRLPEPLRAAHMEVTRRRRAEKRGDTEALSVSLVRAADPAAPVTGTGPRRPGGPGGR